jgi:multisubunit Na+/H+ antiporter MnhG subunit
MNRFNRGKILMNVWLAILAVALVLFFIGVVTESRVVGNIVTALFIVLIGSFIIDALIKAIKAIRSLLK